MLEIRWSIWRWFSRHAVHRVKGKRQCSCTNTNQPWSDLNTSYSSILSLAIYFPCTFLMLIVSLFWLPPPHTHRHSPDSLALHPLQRDTMCPAWFHVLLSPLTYWCQCLLSCVSAPLLFPSSLLAPLMSGPQLKPVIICCGASSALTRPSLEPSIWHWGKRKKRQNSFPENGTLWNISFKCN